VAITEVANAAPATSVMAQRFGSVIPDDGLLDEIIATPRGWLEGLRMLSSLAGSALARSPATHDNCFFCGPTHSVSTSILHRILW